MEKQERWLPREQKNRKAFYIFVFFSLFILFLLLMNAYYITHETKYNEYRVTDAISMDLIEPDGNVKENISPADDFPEGSRVRIRVPIPLHSDRHQYMLAFTTIRTYPTVSYNGHILYSISESDIPRSRHFGSMICMVELPPAAYGSTVTIEEEMLDHNPRPFLGNILVMPTKKSYTYYLQQEGLLFILYHTLLTLSLAAILVFLCLKKKDFVKKGLALALFLASFVLWGLGYHHMLGFWIPSDNLCAIIEYGSLFFLPAPLLYYLYLSENERRRKAIYHRLSQWFLLLFTSAMLLHLGTPLTLDDILPLLHLSILLACLFVCWYQLHPLGKEEIWTFIIRWGILISVGAAGIDTAQYYIAPTHGPLQVHIMQALATWALLVFVLSVTLSYFFQILSQAEEAQEKKAALRVARHDVLTGLLNHGGIFHAAEKLDSEKAYSLLFMDLNGLKEVNDLYGHMAGDKLLRHMADILRSSAGKDAACGRLGGDEFIAILPPEKTSSIPSIADEIQKKLKALKGMPQMPKDPSASFGWSIHAPAQPLTFEDHLKEADDRMYQEKAAYKKSHPVEAGRNFRREK